MNSPTELWSPPIACSVVWAGLPGKAVQMAACTEQSCRFVSPICIIDGHPMIQNRRERVKIGVNWQWQRIPSQDMQGRSKNTSILLKSPASFLYTLLVSLIMETIQTSFSDFLPRQLGSLQWYCSSFYNLEFSLLFRHSKNLALA